MKTTARFLAIAVLGLGVFASEANACTKRKTGAAPLVVFEQTGATTWNVCVPGWLTLATAKDKFCAMGLSVPSAGVITAAGSAVMYDETTMAKLSQFSFTANGAVGTNFNAKQAGNWTGFLAQAGAAVPANIPVMYCFEVTTQSGTTAAQMTTALQSSIVGGDESDAQGNLSGKSQVIFTFTTANANDVAHNYRVFHNAPSSNVSTRATVDQADMLYFMQPRDFRFGYGAATGWRGSFQDQNPATGESLQVGYVKYASPRSLLPDVTAPGTLATAQFTIFGTAGLRAREFTLTTAGRVPLGKYPIDPYIGLSVTLPAPQSWPADGVTFHTQDGKTLTLPLPLRKQWTYRRQGAAAVAFRDPGSTHHLAALYDEATQQVYALSRAYGGPPHLLLGPESLRPHVSGGELPGFLIHSDRFKAGSAALILVSPAYLPVGLPVGASGTVLVQNFGTTLVVLMNAQGVGQSIGFPVPPWITIAAQAALLNFNNLSLRFSDAARFTTR